MCDTIPANGTNYIPGPAGNPGLALHHPDHAPTSSAACCLHARADAHPLKKGEIVHVAAVTRGIAGELTLLLKRQDEQTIRASATKAAVQKLGVPLRAGDTLLIETDVHPISSSHYNPIRLICLGSDSFSKLGEPKIEDEDEDERACDGVLSAGGGSGRDDRGAAAPQQQQQHHQHHQHHQQQQRPLIPPQNFQTPTPYQQPQQITTIANNHTSECRFQPDDERETTLCQETQPTATAPKPTTTVASVNPAQQQASTCYTNPRPKGSMDVDLYDAFTDEDDDDAEGTDKLVAVQGAGLGRGPPGWRPEPVEASPPTTRPQEQLQQQQQQQQPVRQPPPIPSPIASSPPLVDQDEPDDLLDGLEDAF